MKIVSVEVFDLDVEGMPAWHPVLVRINTDEGISGLGEAGLAYGTGHSAAAGMVRNLAETFVLGADPFQSEKLWETMFRRSFWAQGGGPVVFGGMSAIDIALWDIKGKALGVPVYQLLGGKTNDRLRTYASQIQFGWEGEWKNLGSPEEYADAARKAVAEGYDCVKIDPIMLDREGQRGANLTRVLTNSQLTQFRDRVGAVREAVGPDVDIILETHSHPSATTAVQLGRVWEEFNCMYYEEPVHYLNVGLQEKVTQSVRIPMAAGERLYTRWGYRQYFEKQTLDVIQPDLCLVGGITEGKKVCDYANIYDITVQVHVCGSPVSTAAALQLEAVIPNFLIHEHHTVAIKDYNIELCKQDYQPVNGVFETPDLPGLGIELNDEVVSQSPHVEVK
ncbi:MAG: mandelate racemase/muconate lactonizing enzyme family protein [Chloroflexi bacterium]|nr:mandelate racemase/muconate lactonizing enzyme family protein [Chloroflexota bacterium]